MHHIAIMKKSWNLTHKILSGEKKVESRWYKTRRAPWDKVHTGDTVYFKNSGEPVTLKAQVRSVKQFANLTSQEVHNILNRYGKDIGLEREDIPKYYEIFQDKRYCVLIFLHNPEEVQPFQISKKGYGAMSAWICVDP